MEAFDTLLKKSLIINDERVVRFSSNMFTEKDFLMKARIIIFVLALFYSLSLLASEQVAKVILLRGQVKAKLADGSIINVKVDQDIPAGATIQTAEKSFVKLTFIDKSQMNLGPNSQMVINAFPKKEAGIITLVKGQIRSKVTKDYMDMSDKSKSKLYIKTKTAAMGIRGTDFQVNYNPKNENTALITFEGKVAMAHIDRNLVNEKFDQVKLERVISSDKAVLVSRGEISAVNLNISQRAMEPTKLGLKQIEALEKNETGLGDETNPDSNSKNLNQESSKQFRNPIPPGAEGTQFSNTPVGIDQVNQKDQQDQVTSKPQVPDGFFNVTTGQYKLPAGSVVDLKTVNIIPPPNNSIFDKNSGTYIVPESLGKIDKATGEYRAPTGLQLSPSGQFVVVDKDAFAKSQISAGPSSDQNTSGSGSSGRSPASNSGDLATNIAPPQILFGAAKAFVDIYGRNEDPNLPPPAGSPLRDKLGTIATGVLIDNTVNRETKINTGTNSTSTKTKIIFSAD